MADIVQKIAITASDTSGLNALERLGDYAEQTREELDRLEKSGAFDTLAGADGVDRARIQIESLASQAIVLKDKIIDASEALAKLDKSSPDYDKQRAEVAKLTDQYAALGDKIRDIPDKLSLPETSRIDATRQNVGVFGDTEGAVRGISGGLSAIGAGGLGSAGNLAAEAFALAESLPLLSAGLSDIADKVKDGVKTFQQGASGAENIFQAASGGIGALTATLSPMTLALLAATAVALPLIAVTKLLSDQYAAAEATAKSYTDELNRQSELQAQIANLQKSGDIAGFNSLLANSQTELDKQRVTVENAQAELAAAQAAYIAGQFDAGEKLFSAEEDAAAAGVAAAVKNVLELGGDNGPLAKAYNDLFAVLESQPEFSALEARSEALEREAEALQINYRLQQQTNELLVNGSTQAFDTRKAQIDKEIAALELLIPQLDALGLESEAVAEAAQGYRDQLGLLQSEDATLTDGVRQVIQAREDEAAAIQDSLASFDKRLQNEIAMSDLLANASTDQVQSRIDDLERERDAITKLLPELKALAETSEEGAAKLAEVEQRLADTGDELSQLENAILPAARAREIVEGLQAVSEAVTTSESKIQEIRADSAATLLKIEQKKRDTELANANQLAKAYSKIADSIRKATDGENAKFMAEARKSAEQFYKEELKRTQDHNQDRLRLLNELANSLAEAEQNNDVVAFLRIQRAGEEKLKQLDTDADAESKERSQQFIEQQQERRQQHDERLSQIREQETEARAQADEQFKERQDQARANFDAEKSALKEQTDQRIEQEGIALAKRLTDLRAQYSLESGLIASVTKERTESFKKGEEQLKTSQTALNESILNATKDRASKEIQREKDIAEARARYSKSAADAFASSTQQAFNAIFATIGNGINALRAQVQGFSQGAGGGSSSAPKSQSSGGGNQPKFVKFGNEGVIYAADGPTLGLFGENLQPNEVEAFVKFDPSKGLPVDKLGMGGSGIQVTVGNFTLSEGVTEQQMTDSLMQMGSMIIQGISDAKKS